MNDVTNLHGPGDPEVEQLLTDALRRSAESVTPSAGLTQIRARVRPRRGRAVLGLVAAASVFAVGAGVVTGLVVRTRNAEPTVNAEKPLVASGVTTTTGPSQTVPPVAPQSSTAPPSNASPNTATTSASKGTVGTATGLPVYWIGKDRKLYREYLSGPSIGTKAESAVSTMLSSKPLDPDYIRGPWAPTSEVTVTQQGQNLTVDLPSGAFATGEVPQWQAEVALQQLVYTVTAATQAQGTVTILVDGRPGRAWGSIDVGSPIQRDVNARSTVWITDLIEGEPHTAGTVTITGNATAFEATLNWSVLRPDGSVVEEGIVQGGANGTYANFTFTVELEPGTYVIKVLAPDMSGTREGTADTKTIIVR